MKRSESVTPRDVVRVLDRALTHDERAAAIRAHRAAKLERSTFNRGLDRFRTPSANQPPATSQPRTLETPELDEYERLLAEDPREAGVYWSEHKDAIAKQKAKRHAAQVREVGKSLAQNARLYQERLEPGSSKHNFGTTY
jgi:hypothetical protein